MVKVSIDLWLEIFKNGVKHKAWKLYTYDCNNKTLTCSDDFDLQVSINDGNIVLTGKDIVSHVVRAGIPTKFNIYFWPNGYASLSYISGSITTKIKNPNYNPDNCTYIERHTTEYGKLYEKINRDTEFITKIGDISPFDYNVIGESMLESQTLTTKKLEITFHVNSEQ